MKEPDCCGHPFDQVGRWFKCQGCGVLYHFEGFEGPIIPWQFWFLIAVVIIATAVMFS